VQITTGFCNSTFSHSLGRKRTLVLPDFEVSERPVWRKADIKPETPEIESENVRFTLICSTDASNLNVIQLVFSLTSLPSVTQPVDATRDYGVPVRKQPTGA
jgi:hypothetical protein